MSATVRSGLVAANSAAIGPASKTPMIAARSEPTAAITASTSSMYVSQGGSASKGSGSELPEPRRSNRISRENVAMRLYIAAATGSSQSRSTLPYVPAETTRSGGPSPTT